MCRVSLARGAEGGGILIPDTIPENHGGKKCPYKGSTKVYGAKLVTCESPFICDHMMLSAYGAICLERHARRRDERKARKDGEAV